jgi:type II secretory pathway pseudopilin PulG
MRLTGNRALTLVESLVSIGLMGVFLSSVLGAFFVSRLSTERSQHKIVAMNILKQYMEREISAGFSGGEDGDGDHYVTVTSADPLNEIPSVPITVDNKVYTLKPDPYYPDNVEDPATHTTLTYQNTHYKITGFVVTWVEDAPGGGAGSTCSERAAVYLFDHGN